MAQRWSGNANEARSSQLAEYEPVISILDPIQSSFEDFRALFVAPFPRNSLKSSPDGSGRPRIIFFGIIAEGEVSKSGISFG